MTTEELLRTIRAEIERLKGQLIRGACAAQIEMETNCKDEAYNEVLSFLDTLPEETSCIYDTNKLTPTPSVNKDIIERVISWVRKNAYIYTDTQNDEEGNLMIVFLEEAFIDDLRKAMEDEQ